MVLTDHKIPGDFYQKLRFFALTKADSHSSDQHQGFLSRVRAYNGSNKSALIGTNR
ncbi:unnamed protein product, partial [Nesidiocoris tenuis]